MLSISKKLKSALAVMAASATLFTFSGAASAAGFQYQTG